MKHCSRCGAKFKDTLQNCPADGEVLVLGTSSLQDDTFFLESREPSPDMNEVAPRDPDLGTTILLDLIAGASAPDTSQMAEEIEDLIFKVCSKCHVHYAGGLDVCPEDGTRLTEQSMLERQSLFGTEGLSGWSLELKKYCPKCKTHFPLHVKLCEKCGSQLMVPTLGAHGLGGYRGHGAPLDQDGQLIDGKYRILKDIGIGGFGSVYLAKHESLGKRYAVKMLNGEFSDATAFRDRFHEEALKLSRLEDENVVKVIDFGEWQSFQYMVTEYVDGERLNDIIYQEKASPLRAAKIMTQVAIALSEAHSKKIVHLDLKPANILVTQKRGRDLVKVIDFGIAEIYSETRAQRQENVSGTPTYMAPEQWRREPLDPRTDIYSFGVIFYEFLAGRPPFRHDHQKELKRAHCEATPRSLHKLRPEVPAELEKIVHRCLEKDPQKRFKSAEELEATIHGYVRRTENVIRKWLRRAGAAMVALLLLGGGAWGYCEYARWVIPDLSVDVVVKAEDGGVLKVQGANWLSSRKSIHLEVRVPDARNRLKKSSQFSYYLSGGERHLFEWTSRELDDAKKIIPVGLEEGKNEIAVEALSDRYGKQSKEKTYEVEVDSSAPRVEILSPQVTFYGEGFPSVRFQVKEDSSGGSELIFGLMDEAGKEIEESSFQIDRETTTVDGVDDVWILKFTKKELLPDGMHKFKITAKDRAENQGDGAFTVLADHEAPKVKIKSPERDASFARRDSLELVAVVSDLPQVVSDPPSALTVTAAITVARGHGFSAAAQVLKQGISLLNGPDRYAREIPYKSLTFFRELLGQPADGYALTYFPGQNVWKTTIDLRKIKPNTFEGTDPRFELRVCASDRAGNKSFDVLPLRLAWETCDRLLWRKDASVMVYHGEVKSKGVSAFFMSAGMVTHRQYALFCKGQGGKHDCPEEMMDLPVLGLSWREAHAYAEWAGLDIPKRSEWLVAAFWDYKNGVEEERVDFTREKTAQGLLQMLGSGWQLVWHESQQFPVRVGGSLHEKQKPSLSEKEKEYLRGGCPAQTPIYKFQWDDPNPDTGFRCILRLNGEKP